MQNVSQVLFVLHICIICEILENLLIFIKLTNFIDEDILF